MKKRLLLCLSILLLLACQRLPAPTPQPTATFLPEPTAVPPTSTATATATAVPTATATPIPPTPTATAVPATAELWLAEDLSLERYPADQPITIHFSTPMDVESSDNPLSITPRLSGGRAWDESRTTFTFTPNEFMEATTYTLHLSDNLRTAAGDPIPNRPEWQLSSLGATTVVALPSTGTTFNTTRPILALSFGQTMDTASVEQALQITPNLPYETSWSNSNPRVVDILLQAPMQLGVVYTLSLSQTVYSTQGAMVPAQTWEYALTEPTLRAVPPTAENRSAPLILQPNYEMSFFRGLTQSLEIEPEVDGVWVEGLTHWFFTPEGGSFPSGQVYTLTLTADIALDDGLAYPAQTLATFGPTHPSSVHPTTSSMKMGTKKSPSCLTARWSQPALTPPYKSPHPFRPPTNG
ncbi:MAG: Ig-like domain-containing protein [Chloroflexi bacterium]|nr:Ig-like domain-containing protein [Chloroflexota bacterium]